MLTAWLRWVRRCLSLTSAATFLSAAFRLNVIGEMRAESDDLLNALSAAFFFSVVGAVVISVFLGSSSRRARDEAIERARSDLRQAEVSFVERLQRREPPAEVDGVDEGTAGPGVRSTLPMFWDVTRKRLDYHYQIASGQARQSVRNAQAAMVVGFVLLVGSAFLAFNARTTAASIVTGSLGAAAAGFACFMSRAFMRSQESATAHLRADPDRPLEFSRFLTAERLIESMDKLDREQQAAIAAQLVSAIAGATAPSSPASSLRDGDLG